MASPRSIPPPITAIPSLEITKRNDRHKHRCMFLGPMPEVVVAPAVRKTRKKCWFRNENEDVSSSSTPLNEEEDLLNTVKDRVYQFFKRHGGRDEDWGEDAERGVREEMLRRWRESEWGQIIRRKRTEPVSSQRWIGSSFEVGNFLGVNLMDEEMPKTPGTPSLATTGLQTFLTAPSTTRTTIGEPSTPGDSRLAPWGGNKGDGPRPVSPSSSMTPLLRPPIWDREDAPPSKIQSEAPRRPSLRPVADAGPASEPNSHLPGGSLSGYKGKGKAVHYSDKPAEVLEEPPVPPKEALARTGSAVEDTSSGATTQAYPANDVKWGDVVMRDRMLVRMSYTREDSLGPNFDEFHNRTLQHINYEDRGEFIVVWKKDRLELYENYHTPGLEWLKGHKHFAYVVPLNSSETKLYLYSFTDMSFCLSCRPTPVKSDSKREWLFHGPRVGTDVFIFKVKSHSRAQDWIWQLWRQLGGQIPPSLEVYCPALDTRVKLAVPHHDPADHASGYAVFSRDNIIKLCTKTLSKGRDWDFLFEQAITDGDATLQLAWRIDTRLDWVWLEDDVTGKRRDWTVLCGLPLKQAGRPAHLEFRLGRHFPTHLHMKDGKRMDEPPDIEGYLDRIKPNTHNKQSVYLATHSGYLFTLSLPCAHPPMPPGFEPHTQDTDVGDTLRETETRRGTQQILEATGVSDLRSIIAVRRAFQLVHRQSQPHPQRDRTTPGWEDEDEFWADTHRTQSDDDDEGGEEGLAKSDDKPTSKMRRCFELLLETGHVVRFEAHSRKVALEWIEHLRQLVSYWRKRHHVDAREEMDLVHAGTGRPRVTPRTHIQGCQHEPAPEITFDTDSSVPELGVLYNWCTLEGCRPILKGGKIYVRKGLRWRYQYIQLFLVAGHLVQYHIKPKSTLYRRRTKRTINLLDAYVVSGYFAAKELPGGQYNPDAPPVARRFQDGLESDDMEEDTLFMIWYHPVPVDLDQQGRGSSKSDEENVSELSMKKRKVEVFRTRSKLERDVWCWAVNCEIEKISRARRVREDRA